jgi:large subunit ribosomal protein L13
MSTFMAKAGKAGEPNVVPQGWWVVDATNQIVGRLAVQIATILRGKHRPQFTPHVDTGEFVVVINAEKVRFSGKKMQQQTYSSYSKYAGGLKVLTAEEVLAKTPERIIEAAVRRMIPRGPLGRQQLSKLKVYKGSNHPHQAQQPKELKVN